MAEYRVVWEIDIDAESSEEAAQKALDIQRDVESTAEIFLVINRITKKCNPIDLTLERHNG